MTVIPNPKTTVLAQIVIDLHLLDGTLPINTAPIVIALPGIWDSYADKVAIAPRLPGLYTRRQAVLFLLAAQWPQVDTQDEEGTVRLSQQRDSLIALMAVLDAEISRYLEWARASRPPATGQPVAAAPAPAVAQPSVRPGQVASISQFPPWW